MVPWGFYSNRLVQLPGLGSKQTQKIWQSSLLENRLRYVNHVQLLLPSKYNPKMIHLRLLSNQGVRTAIKFEARALLLSQSPSTARIARSDEPELEMIVKAAQMDAEVILEHGLQVELNIAQRLDLL